MMENKVYRPQIRLYRDRPADKIIIEKNRKQKIRCCIKR